MFDRMKNLKLVQKLKESVSPRLRWLAFSNKNKLDKPEVIPLNLYIYSSPFFYKSNGLIKILILFFNYK